MTDKSMEFIASFIKYFDKEGIYDSYDKDSNTMVTSPGVQKLIEEARLFFPDMKNGRSAKAMRELTEEERDRAVVGNDKIVDCRKLFARKIAANNGRRGLLTQVLEAAEAQDMVRLAELKETVQTLENYENGENA